MEHEPASFVPLCTKPKWSILMTPSRRVHLPMEWTPQHGSSEPKTREHPCGRSEHLSEGYEHTILCRSLHNERLHRLDWSAVTLPFHPHNNHKYSS
eukprot:CCRYP_021115-RA/>CCRYP_021115-RA protein AED:0.00 eAED:0.00 QI:163/1/1/1/0/0/2/2/95